MGLARELQRDFEHWQAMGRSNPILAGFVWEGNVLRRFPDATWVGRAWLPALLLQGPGMECFPLSPPWFSRLQNEYSDSCLLEEKRGSWTVFPDTWSSLKNTIHMETCSEAVLSSSPWGIFWGHALRAVFFSCMFCFTENWALRNRQVPWRLVQSRSLFCCNFAFIIFSLGMRVQGQVPGVQVGCSRERGAGGRKPSQSHHPLSLCLQRSSPQ